MTYEFCPVCGGRLDRQSGCCRTGCFKMDPDYYPFLYEEISTPDTWDDGVIPEEEPDQEEGGWQYL